MGQKKTDEFDQLMELAKYEDLVCFIQDYARDNLVFRKELMTFLGRKYLRNKSAITSYQVMMHDAFEQTRDLGDRWHSFEVIDWGAVADNVEDLLNEGKRLLDLGNADAAAATAVEFFAVLQQEFNEENMCDDGEEYELENVCKQAQELLLDAFESDYMNKSLRVQLMNRMRDISTSSLPYDLNNFGIYDFDHMMLQLGKLTMTDDERLQMLEQQIVQHAGRYDQHTYVRRKIDLLRDLNRDAEADAEQQKYIRLPEVRNLVIDQCVQRGDYDTAVRLVHEGIDEAMALSHYGTVNQWREKELAIYEHKGDKEQQVAICRALFISRGADREYYRKLKALIPPEQWKGYLAELIDQVKNDGGFDYIGQSNIADIYVEEHDSESLFRFINKKRNMSLDVLDRYAQYAGDNHAGELLAAYSQLLKLYAEQNVKPKAYQRIAEAMSCMTRLKGGKQAAHQLAEFFRQAYSRRPSMMATISKF